MNNADKATTRYFTADGREIGRKEYEKLQQKGQEARKPESQKAGKPANARLNANGGQASQAGVGSQAGRKGK